MEDLFFAVIAMLFEWEFWAVAVGFLVLGSIASTPEKLKDLYTLTLENNVRLRHIESLLEESNKDPS